MFLDVNFKNCQKKWLIFSVVSFDRRGRDARTSNLCAENEGELVGPLHIMMHKKVWYHLINVES